MVDLYQFRQQLTPSFLCHLDNFGIGLEELIYQALSLMGQFDYVLTEDQIYQNIDYNPLEDGYDTYLSHGLITTVDYQELCDQFGLAVVLLYRTIVNETFGLFRQFRIQTNRFSSEIAVADFVVQYYGQSAIIHTTLEV